MGLRLASATDCTLFAFWYAGKIRQGINCQGELFIMLKTFPVQHQGDAYNCAAEIESGLGAALVLISKTRYAVGADLSRQGWQVFTSAASPASPL